MTDQSSELRASNSQLEDFVVRLTRGEDLTRREAGALLAALLNNDATDSQIAAALLALRTKGETVDELTGLAEGMRARATRINSNHSVFIDTAGTGSSCAKTFNISTAAAFVIAGAGLPVAKHGNRAASSKCGSADVLSALGVDVSVSPEISEWCLSEVGICFMFAPLYHGATARVAAVRRELGVQTTFNLLGPLTNPAGAPRQLIGISDRNKLEAMARALALLGTERAWVVHGEDGLDEVTLAGVTSVAEVKEGQVRTFEVAPEEFGLKRATFENVRGGDAAGNATIIRNVLTGVRKDVARDLVLVNSAAALYVGGAAPDLITAIELAEKSIDSGSAEGKLDELVRATSER